MHCCSLGQVTGTATLDFTDIQKDSGCIHSCCSAGYFGLDRKKKKHLFWFASRSDWHFNSQSKDTVPNRVPTGHPKQCFVLGYTCSVYACSYDGIISRSNKHLFHSRILLSVPGFVSVRCLWFALHSYFSDHTYSNKPHWKINRTTVHFNLNKHMWTQPQNATCMHTHPSQVYISLPILPTENP